MLVPALEVLAATGMPSDALTGICSRNVHAAGSIGSACTPADCDHAAIVQVVFAVIAPRQVLPNLVAGAIAEAGANQAGDMMQVRPCPSLHCGDMLHSA